MIRLYLLTPLELILKYVVEDKLRAGETQVQSECESQGGGNGHPGKRKVLAEQV